MRRSGILMPVSALPGAYGIGCFSREAYAFVDMLKEAGQSLWQILPLGPTGFGDSPYQSFSTFAGNPYFIDLKTLIGEGLLTEAECRDADLGDDPRHIDYGKLYRSRFDILRLAFGRAKRIGVLESESYENFCRDESGWLPDYALFMALKAQHDDMSWDTWEPKLRFREPEALARCRADLEEEISFQKYIQYLFSVQWQSLKSYANSQGIRIIGDIPIYVAMDSADTWADPELFMLDEDNIPTAVAGCPPDAFSSDGQLWGNPLYNWDYHRDTGYRWWTDRIAHCFKIYDVVRIDHFRGFESYYAVPFGDETARNGCWMPGPGMDLFTAIRSSLGDLPIIAEDLGFLTDQVKRLLADSGYPGMKVLEFAFDPGEDSDYLPHNHVKNCVVYTGTHDNDTLMGWYGTLSGQEKRKALDYMGNVFTPEENIYWDYILMAMRSVADTCIIPVQDFLGLGSEARINIPSTLGGNWTWRMDEGMFSRELIEKIRRVTELTGRLL